ncbi:hypothetical protein J6590_071429 [Homalodisca vitripennis]|nr:hypothetical protein J6590_071429 [Homalodisca vitripennis]
MLVQLLIHVAIFISVAYEQGTPPTTITNNAIGEAEPSYIHGVVSVWRGKNKIVMLDLGNFAANKWELSTLIRAYYISL